MFLGYFLHNVCNIISGILQIPAVFLPHTRKGFLESQNDFYGDCWFQESVNTEQLTMENIYSERLLKRKSSFN